MCYHRFAACSYAHLFSRSTNKVSLCTFLANYGWESNLMAARKH